MTAAPLAYLLGLGALLRLYQIWKLSEPRLTMRAAVTLPPTLLLTPDLIRYLVSRKGDPLSFFLAVPLNLFVLSISFVTFLLLIWRLWFALHRPTSFEGAPWLAALVYFLPGMLISMGYDRSGRMLDNAALVWLWTSLLGLVPAVLIVVFIMEASLAARRARPST